LTLFIRQAAVIVARLGWAPQPAACAARIVARLTLIAGLLSPPLARRALSLG